MKYWRSLDELEKTPEFVDHLHREFPQAASEFPTDVSRRQWLQLMGASIALSSVAGCRWEDEKIAPFVNRPQDRIPGVPVTYFSMMDRGGYAQPIRVTSMDGRPIKLDGNPLHPFGTTGSDSFVQATILNLYDPDRISRDPQTGRQLRVYSPSVTNTLRFRDGKVSPSTPKTWGDFEEFVGKLKIAVGKNQGLSCAVLADVSSSPSRARLKAALQAKYPQLAWVEYSPTTSTNDVIGLEQAFGQPVRLTYDLAKAKTIVCFDADLLGHHPGYVQQTKGWATKRAPEDGEMSRVYAIESQFSQTGIAADHRLPVMSSSIPALVKTLSGLVESLNGNASAELPSSNATEKLLASIAKDLVASKGTSVVAVGSQHAPEVHIAVAALNNTLGNFGQTIKFVEEPLISVAKQDDTLPQLVKAMREGTIKELFILGGNPVYDMPVDYDFAGALKTVQFSIHLSQYEDETSLASNWHLPQAHSLEAWGDGISYDGTVCLQQPQIMPLHQGKSDLEVLSMLIDDAPKGGFDIVKETMNSVYNLDDAGLKNAIHQGFVADSSKAVTATLAGNVATTLASWAPEVIASADQYELVFTESDSVYDGRFANNGWLQEAPAFVTKVTWDNVAIFSPKTAREFKVKDGQIVELSLRDRKLKVAVAIVPGQATHSIGLALGYGRTAAGHVGGSDLDGVKPVGFNAYLIRPSDASSFSTGLKITATSENYLIAKTQDHWAIDTAGMKQVAGQVGALVREGTLTEYEEHHDFATHRVHVPPLESLWKEFEYTEPYQWGMSIDLAKCTGCNACVVACQSENNVPIVGKDQVSRNREMHWLRIDRYFTTSSESAHHEGDHDKDADPIDALWNDEGQVAIASQPLPCQQCENAPCEQVCPVAATVHSEEGLNDMAYNRCIGTRYCGNNCPYKVRRFNYLSYTKHLYQPEQQLVQLVFNPEVTVRSRGVMEKCTYCVQRIQNGKITAKNNLAKLGRDVTYEDRMAAIPDGMIKSACQEACPADAIVFGNIKDHSSQVYKNHSNPRTYAMLSELNVKPRTRYMARVKNPHPDLEASYYLQPQAHHGGEHAAGHGEGEGDHAHDHDHDHSHDHDHDDAAAK